MNLFINARDALQGVDSPRAQIEVIVERRPGRVGAPAALQVQVRDTGAGIAPDIRGRVFEPFFTTKPIGHGTGLGLATVWASVRAHRGSISCDSAPGGGTTFTIQLPLDDRAADATPEGAPADATPGNGELVLIIDDEPALRQIIAALLTRAGYRVATAASGAEGVERFRAAPADLVLLDHSMPGQPPATTLAQLRALAPGLPIISFSGLGATLVDATAHLHKPVDSNTLLAAIRAVLPPAP
ncbi:MAG: response regulator [Myxococcales bacterium]|nr:response regulator [Myxococcales bacterium]